MDTSLLAKEQQKFFATVEKLIRNEWADGTVAMTQLITSVSKLLVRLQSPFPSDQGVLPVFPTLKGKLVCAQVSQVELIISRLQSTLAVLQHVVEQLQEISDQAYESFRTQEALVIASPSGRINSNSAFNSQPSDLVAVTQGNLLQNRLVMSTADAIWHLEDLSTSFMRELDRRCAVVQSIHYTMGRDQASDLPLQWSHSLLDRNRIEDIIAAAKGCAPAYASKYLVC